jgi:hypothetical protein
LDEKPGKYIGCDVNVLSTVWYPGDSPDTSLYEHSTILGLDHSTLPFALLVQQANSNIIEIIDNHPLSELVQYSMTNCNN